MLKSVFFIAVLGIVFSGSSLWGEEDLSLSEKLDGHYYYKDGKKGTLATLTGQEPDSYELHLVDSIGSDPSVAEAGPPAQVQPAVKKAPDNKVFEYRPSLTKHDVYARGDFLYWKASEPETEYVITHFPPQIPNISVGAVGNLKPTVFDWQPGFRVAAGAVLTPDFWDLEAQYTQIDPDGSAHAKASGNNAIRGVWNQETFNTPTSASSRISLSYKTADLILGKRWRISSRLLARFYTGLTGAWIHQHFNIRYNGTPPQGSSVEIQMKWGFQGGGLQVGWDYDWFIGKGISLFGWIKGGLLYGHYRNRTFTEKFPPNPQVIENVRLSENRIATMLQLALGPSWGKMFSRWGINFFAGYELTMWFNLHEQLHGDTSGVSYAPRPSVHPNAPLSLQGFTGRFEISF
ncbi:MAG: hypothetical protein JSR57_07835 [Verrucomicrobia bacterium]|nr:hypothetical protein [Verrucomicrobiota bacterium]